MATIDTQEGRGCRDGSGRAKSPTRENYPPLRTMQQPATVFVVLLLVELFNDFEWLGD